ncbi:hypothetical protein GUJ93_ZPchr0010g8387 [Zizania palustris]|uniref:Uncharacterized protein n=1 Tax=Zizania palustris TaxID=103762 RepID=A0A8J5WFM5_ZIZPA|nr:hypothetical protein GUJ93_ZPchr0010g8387 [Zizania palustris]
MRLAELQAHIPLHGARAAAASALIASSSTIGQRRGHVWLRSSRVFCMVLGAAASLHFFKAQVLGDIIPMVIGNMKSRLWFEGRDSLAEDQMPCPRGIGESQDGEA